MNQETEYRPSFGKWIGLHLLPPILILLIGSAAILMVAKKLRPEATEKPSAKIVPTVEIVTAEPSSIQVSVDSQGTVEARTQTTLVAEVSGRVEQISPALYAGGFFKKGDLLASLDKTDYQANLASARSRLAEAELALQQEQAASTQAAEDWKAMGNQNQASDLVLRKPQLQRARSVLEAAQAAVQAAERDLARTEIRAPYDGRVQRKFIDIGQFATARSSQIASIYSVDTAEVRLAISLDQLRLLRIPETYRDGSTNDHHPAVTITASYGGVPYQWQGLIDRSEGAVDPQTRLINLVATITDPYANSEAQERPPLRVGTFVTAAIYGNTIEDAFQLPRHALKGEKELFIIKDDNTLERREVEIAQKTSEIIIVTKGLRAGENVCLTPLQFVVNGMEVQIAGEEEIAESPAEEVEADV